MTDIMISTIKALTKEPERVIKAGEIIFREGDVQTVVFGIIAGEVEMSLQGQFIETIKPGEIFGVGALVHGDRLRTSTAIAKTECRLVTMDRQHFLFAVQQTPMFALEVIQSYSDRYRSLKEAYQAAIAP